MAELAMVAISFFGGGLVIGIIAGALITTAAVELWRDD